MSNIKYLLLSRTLSEFATAVLPVVFPLFILELKDSLAFSGFFFMLSMLPSLLVTPFAGVWIEKHLKRTIILIMLLMLSLLCEIQFILISFKHLESLTVLLIFASLLGIFSMGLDLSSKVFFTEIVEKRNLEKYNGIKSVLDNLSIFLAPMLGTFLYALFGFGSVLLFLGFLYFISFLAFSQIKIERQALKITEEEKFSKKFKEGLNFVRHEKAVFKYFMLIMILNFFVASSEEVTNPAIVIQKYQISSSLFAFVSVAFSLGVIVSGLFIARNSKIEFRKQLPKLFILNSLVMILIGMSSLLLFALNHYVFFSWMLFLEVLLGFVTILINVPVTSFFQSSVPLNYQSRFFALLSFSARLAIPFGIFYTGILSEKIGADLAYILNNLLVILIVLLFFRKELKSLKS